MTEKEQAIAYIEECRASHVAWQEFQEGDQDWRTETEPDDVGGPEHHREWIGKYDLVLRVLRTS